LGGHEVGATVPPGDVDRLHVVGEEGGEEGVGDHVLQRLPPAVVEERQPAPGEVEGPEAPEVLAHVQATLLVVADKGLLVGVAGVEEHAQPRQEQASAGELVVPAEHGQVEDVVECLGALGELRVGGEAQVGGVARGVVHPRGAPDVLVPVAGGVVEGLDVLLVPGVGGVLVGPPVAGGEPEHGDRAVDELLGVGGVVAERDGGGRQGRGDLPSEVGSRGHRQGRTRVRHVLRPVPAVVVVRCPALDLSGLCRTYLQRSTNQINT